jgi:hypothetical protein
MTGARQRSAAAGPAVKRSAYCRAGPAVKRSAYCRAGRAAVWLAVSALGLACLCGCASTEPASAKGRELSLVRQPSGPEGKKPFKLGEAVELPFYVMNNSVLPPPRNFALSGFMGDIADLVAVGGYSNTLIKGRAALKVRYLPKGSLGWAGAVWQNPANSWGAFDGGYNLTPAGAITFWARGEKGGEIVVFSFGGTSGTYPDSDSLSTGPMELGGEWMQYVMDLSGADLRYISAGFGFSVSQDMNPQGCTFYLDDIRYDK